MLRGTHKQMIVVRTRDSRLFEEAHFVMRRGANEGGGDDLDLVFEANRIIESSLPRTAPRTVGGAAAARRGTARSRGGQTDRDGTGGTGVPGTVAVPVTESAARERRRWRLGGRFGEEGIGLVAGLVWFFGGFLTGSGLVALLWWIM